MSTPKSTDPRIVLSEYVDIVYNIREKLVPVLVDG